jgi:hypothetical protein
MRRFKTLFASVPALFLACTILSADSVTVTLTEAGPVNDGSDYVLPYELTINGLIVNADCYDFFDQIEPGQTWQANELTLSEAASYGQFSGLIDALTDYEEVGWLSSQATPTAQDQIDLQHAIWNVFDPAVVVPDDMFLNGVLAAEAGGISGFDFDNTEFLEAVPVDGTRAQAFVLQAPNIIGTGINNGQDPTSSPEPGAALLVSIGLGLIGISIMRRVSRAHWPSA